MPVLLSETDNFFIEITDDSHHSIGIRIHDKNFTHPVEIKDDKCSVLCSWVCYTLKQFLFITDNTHNSY